MSSLLKSLAARYATHPVSLAILPFKTAAMDDREAHERRNIAALQAELEANGMDANKVAPFPHRQHSPEAMLARGKYDFCHAVARTIKSRGMGDPCIVQMDDKLITKYITKIRDEAAEEYEGFVYKLCGKTGEDVTAANLAEVRDEGCHGYALWQYSVLTISKASGTVERWKTKSILNTSKFGRLFRQYPSRKVNA